MSKKRILIVDDEPDLCDILRFNLEAAGYEVATANSAEEAIGMLNSEGPADAPTFDLLLLDVMMPGMSGFELAGKLKQNGSTSQLPIIFLTALGGEEDLLHGFHLGADDYIAKPFSVREVLARVTAVLARTAQVSANTPVAIDLHAHRVLSAEDTLRPSRAHLLTRGTHPTGLAQRRDCHHTHGGCQHGSHPQETRPACTEHRLASGVRLLL